MTELKTKKNSDFSDSLGNLKTLKDIDLRNAPNRRMKSVLNLFEYNNAIRQEAIKDIKELRKAKKEGYFMIGDYKRPDDICSLVCWIKFKNNLTEEDMK